MHNNKKTAIIGSGPAGLTAAIYLARAGLSPDVYAGSVFGGQLMITTDVENYPGYDEGIQGPELMEKMIHQAKRFGANILYQDITKVDFSQKPYKLYTTDSGEQTYEGIVIATGAQARNLGVPGEIALTGRGISYCATCDGAFFRGQEIAVVGGGDSAMEEALFLTKFASKVYLLHRRNTFRASKIMQDKVLANEKITPLFNTIIKEVHGSEKLTGATIQNTQTNEQQELAVTGIFIAIGHIPNTSIFQGQLALNEQGYVIVNGSKTDKEGIFCAGDVDDMRYRQAITAAGEGCKAAIDLEKYFEGI